MTISNIQETVRFIVACRNFRHRKYRNIQYCPDFTTCMETTIASLCAAWVTNIMTQRNALSGEMITGRRHRKGVLYPHPSLLLTTLSSLGISLLSPPMFPACNASQLLASYFLSTGKVISPTKVRVVCIQQGEMKAIECIDEANSSFCKESNNTSHEEYRESPTINTAIYLTFWLSSNENVPTHCMWADIKVATKKKLPEVEYLQLHFLLESGIGKLRNDHLSGSLLIVEQHL